MRRRLSTHYDTKSHISKDRWMVSYADFITLLFAFFVVMYAVSAFQNEGKYRVLSESIVKALARPKQQEGEGGEVAQSEKFVVKPEIAAKRAAEEPPVEDIRIKSMADSIRKALQQWIDMGLIQIHQSPVRLEIEINASVLYDSGKAVLAPAAAPILQLIADVLRNFPNAIHIEGFTDNRPISNETYPSNWELSTARAAAVVRMFKKQGIQPERMAAIGYGEYRPVADNSTAQGRNRNRRVVVVVLSSTDPSEFVEIVKQSKDTLKDAPVEVRAEEPAQQPQQP